MEAVVKGWLPALTLTCLLCLPGRGDGGLLILCPDPHAPLVAIEIWVRAGSADETRETSGAAHLLEHLIFKGTSHHPPGTLDAAVEAAGGILEASTEREWTRYRMAVLPDRWETPLRMLLEHLLQPALPEAELMRERELILRDEYALHQADPLRVARYALYAQVYGEHPYALPPLGIPESLAKLSREQLVEFHARFYRPDRMVIVVVGPVEAQQVREVITAVLPLTRTFSPAGGGDLPLTPSLSPAGRGGYLYSDLLVRYEQTVAEANLLAIAVPAPAAVQPEAMLAAEVVHLALAEPYLGLLWASDDGQAIFTLLQSEYVPRLQSGLMLFFFQCCSNAGDDWKQRVRQRWQASIRQIIEGRARPQLERAKQWLMARHQQAMRNPLERARLYAFYATLGLPSLPDEYAARVESLTAEQIERVARAIFAAGEWEVEPLLVRFSSRSAPQRGAGEGEIFRQTLASGTRVIALRQPGTRQVVIQVLVASGPDAEHGFPTGTAELTARMLFTTTLNETSASLADRIARSGGSLQLHWEPIGVRITAVAEPATLENVLSLLKEGLARAEFDSDALKNALCAAIAERRRMDGIHELPLYDALFRRLDHASLYATAEQLQRVRLEDLRAFYQRYYRPDRFVMVIAGDLPVEQLTELMQRYFGVADGQNIPISGAGSAGDPLSDKGHPAESVHVLIVDAFSRAPAAPTFYIGFGLRVPVRSSEEYAALLVWQAMLCEGKGSLLFRQFREGQGLGYAFGGRTVVWRGEGLLLGFLQLGTERASRRDELLNRLRTALRLKTLEPAALCRAVALVEARWRRDQMDIFEHTRRLVIAEASGVGYLAEQNLPELLKKMEPALFAAFGVK